jgi:hypothetical protein
MTVWVISILGCAVDALADQVRVAVMARVVLDRVQVDPVAVRRALRMVTGVYGIINLFSGTCGPGLVGTA